MRFEFVIFLFLVVAQPATAEQCTPAQALAADAAMDNLHTWSSIFGAYQQYAKCDGGSVGEGFSDSIVHLLATNWESLFQAKALIAKDPKFQSFLVRHIDASADTSELESVAQLALHSCPRSAKSLCSQIAVAAASSSAL